MSLLSNTTTHYTHIHTSAAAAAASLRVPPKASAAPAVAAAATKPSITLQPTTAPKHLPLRWHNDTLRWGHRIPQSVVAIGVVHVSLPEPRHGLAAARGHGGEVLGHQGRSGVAAVAGEDLVDRIDDAAVEDEVFELGDEGLVAVVDLLLAAAGGPG